LAVDDSFSAISELFADAFFSGGGFANYAFVNGIALKTGTGIAQYLFERYFCVISFYCSMFNRTGEPRMVDHFLSEIFYLNTTSPVIF
jgi:hypothetical protein